MDMHNVTLTHHLASQIRNRHSEVGIQKRLSEKYKWNYQLQREIDMESFRQNFTSFTCTQQRFYTKLLHQLLPLNQRQFQMKLSPTQFCPICKINPETETHFLHCTHCDYNAAVNDLKEI